MAGIGKEYVIGKGRLFFNQFTPGTKVGTGELYLGNTPELSASSDSETLDHYDSDQGLNVKDESITVENSLTLTFTTDNISPENLTLWFAGDKARVTVTPATNVKERFAVVRGRFYQLGVSQELPAGVRKVTNVSVSKVESNDTLTPITAAGNVDIDLEHGRVYIEIDAADIQDGDTLEVTYDVEASTRTVIIGRGQEIRGSLRFISANPVGKQRHYYWPYVKLSANGDYALKGDEWQQMSFTAEVLKLDAQTERVYIEAED